MSPDWEKAKKVAKEIYREKYSDVIESTKRNLEKKLGSNYMEKIKAQPHKYFNEIAGAAGKATTEGSRTHQMDDTYWDILGVGGSQAVSEIIQEDALSEPRLQNNAEELRNIPNDPRFNDLVKEELEKLGTPYTQNKAEIAVKRARNRY